jgi:NAD(P)H-dependent flavin oxidoreductase YrpB (nitropropane dioxygenase family)
MAAIGTDVELPAAVSRAGAMGMIGAAGMSAKSLERLIDAMSAATTGPFGVNFLMPFLDRDAVAVAARRAATVEFFYGWPEASLVESVHDSKALVAWQVGSAAEAVAAADAGCDFLIAQGIEAGGHVRGTQPLTEVLREVVDAVAIPVVAAGGIGTAEAVVMALDSGAAGVRVGTRFVAAYESTAHPTYIDALISATAADTVITKTFAQDWPDAPHRVLRSAVASAEEEQSEFVAMRASRAGERRVPRFATMPPTRDVHGNVAAMALYAGTSVEAVRERLPVDQIIDELLHEI